MYRQITCQASQALADLKNSGGFWKEKGVLLTGTCPERVNQALPRRIHLIKKIGHLKADLSDFRYIRVSSLKSILSTRLLAGSEALSPQNQGGKR